MLAGLPEKSCVLAFTLLRQYMVPLIASQKQQADVPVFVTFTPHFRTSFPNMRFGDSFFQIIKEKKKILSSSKLQVQGSRPKHYLHQPFTFP